MNFNDATALIRDIPDYPKPGILFRDITPLLADPDAFTATIEQFDEMTPPSDYIAGAEARGFIFASALAYRRRVGFIPLRKPGKLPGDFHSVSYGLEYGTDSLQVHKGQIRLGATVLLIDDVLATGGTAAAGIELIHLAGGSVTATAFLLEIEGLDGRERIHRGFPELSCISLVTG